jgi:hypothetical protein
MRPGVDVMLARLRPLPPRLRVAHLAALLRVARAAGERSLSYASPRLAVGSEASEARSREGRSVAHARVGGLLVYPHPAHRSPSLTMIHPPRKGQGSDLSNGSLRDGRAG